MIKTIRIPVFSGTGIFSPNSHRDLHGRSTVMGQISPPRIKYLLKTWVTFLYGRIKGDSLTYNPRGHESDNQLPEYADRF